jgi:hypothetical protein
LHLPERNTLARAPTPAEPGDLHWRLGTVPRRVRRPARSASARLEISEPARSARLPARALVPFGFDNLIPGRARSGISAPPVSLRGGRGREPKAASPSATGSSRSSFSASGEAGTACRKIALPPAIPWPCSSPTTARPAISNPTQRRGMSGHARPALHRSGPTLCCQFGVVVTAPSTTS